MTQTTEGTGVGSVERLLPKILNGVVKSSNIPANTIIDSDVAEGSITSSKIASGAITLDKLASDVTASLSTSVQGGLKSAEEVLTSGRIKIKAVFSDPITSLEISGNGDWSPVSLMISYKKITQSGIDSGIITQIAATNTWYVIDGVQNDGETIEAFVSDRSFHTSYRITMQLRQNDVGSTHLVIESLIFED